MQSLGDEMVDKTPIVGKKYEKMAFFSLTSLALETCVSYTLTLHTRGEYLPGNAPAWHLRSLAISADN